MSLSKVTDALSGVLADSYVLLAKTQNYHWNVVGPYFHSLHLLFESQYTELFPAIDEIAERIRQLGKPSPGTMAEFLNLTVLSEAAAHSAPGMVADLAACQEKIAGRLRASLKLAEAAGDDGTVDLMVRRLEAHDKNGWMLRSTLGDEGTVADSPVVTAKSVVALPKKAKKKTKAAKSVSKPIVAKSAPKKVVAPKSKPAVKSRKASIPAKPKGKVAVG